MKHTQTKDIYWYEVSKIERAKNTETKTKCTHVRDLPAAARATIARADVSSSICCLCRGTPPDMMIDPEADRERGGGHESERVRATEREEGRVRATEREEGDMRMSVCARRRERRGT